MFTPEISVEIANSGAVIWRPQPPAWMRRRAKLKDAQKVGIDPTSVGGGSRESGIVPASVGSFGPRMARVCGMIALAAPCGA